MGCVSSKTTDAIVTPPVQTPETRVIAAKTQKEDIEQEQLAATMTVVDEPAAEPATRADAPLVEQGSDQLAQVQCESVDVDNAIAEPPAKIDCVDETVYVEEAGVVHQTEDEETRGISVRGGCCGIHGGAGIGCHGLRCGLGRCGIGGGFRAAQMDESDAMPIESDIVQIDDESRGIDIGGSCCGVSGGAGIGCHGFHCGLGRCGIGGGLRAAQMNDNDVAPIESDEVQIDDESREIGIGGSCCGIGGGAGIGCHGFHCGLGRCGIGCGF